MKYLFLAALFALSAVIWAHPASDIGLDFDLETTLLTVNFNHQVKNAENHFIYEVKVFLNKDEIIEQKLEKQETAEGGELIYKIIDAKPGDEIKVQINCNKFGKKSAEIEL